MLGFGDPEATGTALAKLAGGRDVALGALTLAARDDAEQLRTLLLVSSACDLADAVGRIARFLDHYRKRHAAAVVSLARVAAA